MDFIADEGCDPAFGARPLKRAIIRLVETNGTNGSVKLDFARPVTITECNMIEWSDTQDIAKDSLSAELKFKPFEIRTLRIKR